MHIAILGGSFDPPHLGHTLIAQQVKERFAVDEVWLMPCYKHTFHKKLSSPADRLAMTKFLENNFMKVSDFEIVQKSKGSTIETLRTLSKRFPNNTFSFIIGSDQLVDFHKWEAWEEIIKNYQIIVFPRELVLGKLSELVKKTLHFVAIPRNIVLMEEKNLILTNISSTAIRQRAKNGKSIKHLVLEAVEAYIYQHKLYV